MPNSFVTLWTLERCRWLQRVKDQGPLEVVFGGVHISLPSLEAVTIGDVVYPVFVKTGMLHVIARLRIEELAAPEEYVRSRLGIAHSAGMMWDQLFSELKQSRPAIGHRFPTTCCDLAATGKEGSDIRFDRVLPSELLDQLTLGPKPGRELPLKGVKDGRITNVFSLQGHVRRLSSGSAALIEGLFG